MVLSKQLLLLLLAGLSSSSRAGTLRSKKGTSSGKGGSGKGASGKGATPPPPPPPSPEVGAPETTVACGVTPPSLTGGCDLACEFFKVAEAGAQAVLGEIPGVGNFVSNLVGVFWPSGPDEEVTVLEETIQYIDAKIVEVEEDIFLTSIEEHYQDLVKDVTKLASHIATNASSRYGLLDDTILSGDCSHLNTKIVDEGLNRVVNMTASPISLLAAIGNIGQSCLAMRNALIYHYNTTVGEPPQDNATVTASKVKLDQWVQDYTTWAQNATQLALAWRISQIQVASSECSGDVYDDGGDPCDSTFAVESITDNACYAVGGPPPYMGFVVGDTKGECACADSFSDFAAYYQSIVTQSFIDNELPVSRSLVPLWKYQTSENVDAGIKPSPVIRAATSIMDSYVKVDFREASFHYDFPSAEMEEIYSIYNGEVSQGQRTDQITSVELWTDAGSGIPLLGVAVSQVVGGQSMTLQVGPSLPTDDYNSYTTYSLTLDANERIVAVGATDCGDPNFVSNGDCLSLGYAFKTAYVNASGAFESEGQLWNPMNYPEDGPWIVAPQLAQSRNATFLPYVIAFHGWATTDSNGDTTLGAKVPVWLYESLE